MKKLTALIPLILFTAVGCASFDLFTKEIGIEDAIARKGTIDKTENPAMQYRLKSELRRNRIIINDALVKDVTVSSNIDYDFCTIVDLTVGDKKIECYIYSPSIKTMSELQKGKTRIDVTGKFERFFSTLDDYYTKVEITQAKIRIKEGK